MTQRGHSLVEVFIALTVLSVLLGGALVPLQSRYQQEERDTTQELLREAKGAIYAYALKNRTSAGDVVYHDSLTYPLPAGRPYLPCPDVTGDGLEDRVAITGYPVTLSGTTGDAAGSCTETKGVLPWKTLGVREVDAWGNRITYRVDERFSSGLVGFDETFLADNSDLLGPLDGVFYSTVAMASDAGALICSDFYVGVVDRGCPNMAMTLNNVVAGVVSYAAVERPPRRVPALDSEVPGTGIVNGAVFVLVSHGSDGFGAISRNGRCRAAPAETNDIGELANAYYRADHPFVTDFGCAAHTGTHAARMSENIFVDMQVSKINNEDVSDPDDMLLWVGSPELLGYLTRGGAFPVERLVFLPHNQR